ncbi:MAG: hypothetical protein HC890_14375, partial [Chloroflexaceae bacterium]|nr:hypothetical protein [Chloroflexaceae bacterium]
GLSGPGLGREKGGGVALLLCAIGLLNVAATVVALMQPRLLAVEAEVPDAISNHSSRELTGCLN